MKKTEEKICPGMKNSVGGQAVIEGVMMKSKTHCAIAVRKTDGSIAVESKPIKTSKKMQTVKKIPVIRGLVNMVSTLKLSMDTITKSTEMLHCDFGRCQFYTFAFSYEWYGRIALYPHGVVHDANR